MAFCPSRELLEVNSTWRCREAWLGEQRMFVAMTWSWTAERASWDGAWGAPEDYTLRSLHEAP